MEAEGAEEGGEGAKASSREASRSERHRAPLDTHVLDPLAFLPLLRLASPSRLTHVQTFTRRCPGRLGVCCDSGGPHVKAPGLTLPAGRAKIRDVREAIGLSAPALRTFS